MIFYKCYGNHDKNKDIDVDKLPEKERKYYVFDINNNNDVLGSSGTLNLIFHTKLPVLNLRSCFTLFSIPALMDSNSK